MGAVALLEETRNVLMSRGWAQGDDPLWVAGSYGTSDGRVCLYGAFRQADEHIGSSNESHAQAYDALRNATGKPVFGVVDWNDRHGRTVAQVFAVIDTAIASLS